MLSGEFCLLKFILSEHYRQVVGKYDQIIPINRLSSLDVYILYVTLYDIRFIYISLLYYIY